MVIPLFETFKSSSKINELRQLVLKDNIVYSSPLSGSGKTLFIKEIHEDIKQLIVLFPDVQEVNEVKVELNILGLNSSEIVVIDDMKLDILQEKLTGLTNKEKFILLSTYDLLKIELPNKSQLEKNTTRIQTGSSITYEELIEYLNMLNYQKNKFVENAGDYSVRGSIIDFWSYSESSPCRLEFDGDFIESIRYFDPESQRSTGISETVTVASNFDNSESVYTSDIFDYLDNPLFIVDKYELIKSFEQKKTDYSRPKVSVEDDELVKELFGNPDEVIVTPVKTNEPQVIFRKDNNYDGLFKKKARWLIEEPLGDTDGKMQLGLYDAPAINANFELLFNILREYAYKDYKILITAENEFQQKRLKDLLTDFKDELAGLIQTGRIKIHTLPLRRGYIQRESHNNTDENLLVLSDYQIFNKPYRTKISSNQKNRKVRAKDFATIKRGDIVVHENYGIGRYSGLENLKIGDVNRESIKILFAEGGVVYVNLNYFHLVKKFSSKDNIEPTLTVLGSGEWDSAKKKVKKKIKEAARELILLYAKRKSSKGFSFNTDTLWQKELEASFFYEDTPDQSRVTEEVKNDMESDSPMDRLVCGDVGFGKTEVAVRAAFKAASNNKQAAVLVPTTILAEQHLNTFKDRLSQFPVRIEGLSRFQTKAKQKEILKELSEGKVDIVIGTHRLLSQDVKFSDLGLLIIDEEHRFGVTAKEKLRNYKVNVDTLTLTATPIPRTLNFSLLGARDLSIIGTPPPNRQPIYTSVQTFDIMKIREWILHEMKRNGQIYFVHDRVQSIEKISQYLHKYIPEVKIAVAHGQMKPAELENVIYDFLHKKYDILLATKIIESGIDIPNVNTIIINRADRFGLAELHQLRGRVGRSDRQAYAYFLVPSLDSINKNAVRRLQAIEEFTEVGAGFNLSMRDLEIRGAGNLLGTEQTGFIDIIGFDMYVKLLDEAVEELKEQEFKEIFSELPKHQMRTDPTIDTYFEIGIPKAYMPDQADRLSFYTALFSMKSISEAEEIKEEMEDRFGKIPPFVQRLIATAVLKFYASYALFERIIIQQKNIMLILPKGDNEEFYKNKFTELMQFIMNNYFNEIKFHQQKETMKLVMLNKFDNPEKIFEFLVDFCKKVSKVVNAPERREIKAELKEK